MLINMCNKWSIEERNKYINKMSGTLYKYDDILLDKLSFIFKKYAYTNPLHPDIYPSLRKMESEIVSMACDIFNLNTKDRCGCLTIGGTESILLAIKTYREGRQRELPGERQRERTAQTIRSPMRRQAPGAIHSNI